MLPSQPRLFVLLCKEASIPNPSFQSYPVLFSERTCHSDITINCSALSPAVECKLSEGKDPVEFTWYTGRASVNTG